MSVGRQHLTAASRPKRSLSPHQRQMRFFTVAFVVLALVLFGVLMCLINH